MPSDTRKFMKVSDFEHSVPVKRASQGHLTHYFALFFRTRRTFLSILRTFSSSRVCCAPTCLFFHTFLPSTKKNFLLQFRKLMRAFSNLFLTFASPDTIAFSFADSRDSVLFEFHCAPSTNDIFSNCASNSVTLLFFCVQLQHILFKKKEVAQFVSPK